MERNLAQEHDMTADLVYLKPNALIEPLFNQWYAWSYLIPPASSAMFLANAHVKLMQSFVASPQIHVSALQNPAMRGGPFLDIPADRAPEVKELLDRTLKSQAHVIEFAEAVKALDKILGDEAKGFSLEALYKKIPEPLKGYIELVYDLKDSASIRFFEGLLYRSKYFSRSSHSLAFSLMQPDKRQFVLSTPRLKNTGDLFVDIPFDSPVLDDLYRMRYQAGSFDQIREAIGVKPEDAELFRTFFTTDAPRPRQTYTGELPRVRYFGHACVLIESPGVSLMFDPVVSYDFDGKHDRFSHADVPETIDYVFITHNHQDHILFEALLELRHRIKTVVVPRAVGNTVIDPSLKLMFEALGFKHVIEMGEMDPLPVPGGHVMGLPFLGEHGDLDIRSKRAFHVELKKHSMLMMADSNNIDPRLYEHIHEHIGDVEVVFIGMECEGAPMSWLYGPLFTRPLVRKNDQSRRFDGSDCDKAIKIIDVFKPKRVYVYAMGQEPWLRHVMNVVYTPESKAIVESDRFFGLVHARGAAGERLFMQKELHF
jgi:L-ascorbate metabolism protein UlaG (beta-lactamase superfamily)